MDVTCEKCRTEYEFDDSLISESGTTVKCTNCGHLFRIYQPGTPETKRKPAWMLRQPDGSVYTFERMTTLQRWIAEGKVSRKDEVSRTGEGWQALGSMDELASFFENAKDALEAQDEEDAWGDDGPTIRRPSPRSAPEPKPQPIAPNPQPAPTPQAASGDGPFKPPVLRPPDVQSAAPIPAPTAQTDLAHAETQPPVKIEPTAGAAPARGEDWAQGALLKENAPAWTDTEAPKPVPAEEPAWTESRVSSINLKRGAEEDETPQSKGGFFKVGVPLLIIGLIAAGIGGLYLFQPELFHQLMSQVITEGSPRSNSEAFLRGREYFLLDTTEGFRQADREFHRAESNDGLSQAGLAEVYTTWSQYSLDEVADARLRAEKAGPAEAAAFAARAEIKNEEFQQKLEQARRFVDAALKKAQGTVEAHRVAADYYRLAGDGAKAKQHISRALQLARTDTETLPETQFTEALVLLTTENDPQAAVQRLQGVSEQNEKLIRCHYRLARLMGALDQNAEARSSLEKVLVLNEEHGRAKRLLSSLDSGTPVLLAVTSTTIQVTSGALSADGGILGDGGLSSDGGTADGGQSETAIATGPADAGTGAPDATATAVATGPGEGLEGAEGAAGEGFESLIRRATKAQSNGSREACSLFRRADRVRGGHPEVLVGLGYCASDSGNRSQAMSYYRRALSSNSGYGPAILAIASAYRSQGNARQALEYYRRYLRSHPSGGQSGIARRNIDRLEEQLREEGGGSEPSGSGPGTEPEGATTTGPETPATPPEGGGSSSPPPESGSSGPAEAPTVIRVTDEPTGPPVVHSDTLATDSEPPLRPGEDLD